MPGHPDNVPSRANSAADPVPAANRCRGYRRVVWAIHGTLGLVFGALLLLSSLTGGVLVMHREIERLVEPERHLLPAGSTEDPDRAALAPLVRGIAAEAPAGYRPLRHMLAQSPGETEKLIFVGPDGRTRWTAVINPHSGEVLWRGPDQSLFTSWLLHLHMHLRLGGWGYVITGLGGAGLFLLGVTGLVIHRRRLASLTRLSGIRGWRSAVGAFHGWLGIGSVYFSLVLGLTGLIYTIKIAPGQIAAPQPAVEVYDLNRLGPIEPALAAARERFPDAELLRVSFPATATGPLTILLLHREAPVWRKFSRIDFDPDTAAIRVVHDARAATAGQKFAAMLAPLHFGFYGSPLVKWAYVVGGFSPALLALSGTAIFILRRRQARRCPQSLGHEEPLAHAA